MDQSTEYKYCILMETNEDEQESWYTFIRYNGNEEAVKYLEKQLESVDWFLEPESGLSAFTLETGYLVSEKTAKEMTKVDLNSQSFHRKFDGKLQMIDLDLKKIKDDDNDRKRDKVTRKNMEKVLNVLGYGMIEKFIDNEDIDPEDLNNSVSNSEDDSSSSSSSDSETSSNDNNKKLKTVPTLLQSSKPLFARKAQSHSKSYKNKNK